MPSPHEQKQACTCSHETPGPRLWAQRPAAARRLKPALGALLREYAVGEKEKKKIISCVQVSGAALFLSQLQLRFGN